MGAKDWVGDKSIRNCNLRNADAEINDYYATEPKAVELLLKEESFSHYVWEPACGGGHISKVLQNSGYDVKNSDIIDRGFAGTEIADFLKVSKEDVRNDFTRDIITNPPYKYAKEFVEHALDISVDSTKVAMFLKLTFLEGQARREMFKANPPKKIYVFSGRVNCAKNGDFENTNSSAVAYAWFVWEKGFRGDPVVKWVN